MNFSGTREIFPIEISIYSDRLSIEIYGQKTDLKVLNIFSIKTYQIFPAGERMTIMKANLRNKKRKIRRGKRKNGIRTLLPHQFYLCNVQSYIFYEAFLYFTNSLRRNYVGFSTKEDFWYVYVTFIRVKNLSFIYTSCKFYAKTSILRKTT